MVSIEFDDVRIHNMHGPTVYGLDIRTNFHSLLKDLDRLNSPRSNGGVYRLFATTTDGRIFELIETPNSKGFNQNG